MKTEDGRINANPGDAVLVTLKDIYYFQPWNRMIEIVPQTFERIKCAKEWEGFSDKYCESMMRNEGYSSIKKFAGILDGEDYKGILKIIPFHGLQHPESRYLSFHESSFASMLRIHTEDKCPMNED